MTAQSKPRHPPGLRVLFFTEMWERFAFYLMLGIFVLYMTDSERNGLGFGETEANEVYGWFIALVYLTPFIGGIIADKFLGYRKSIVLGGLLMAVGYLGIGLLPGLAPFYASLALVVFGNGFFKPNISSIVGRLYEEGSPLKDAGYNIFYMGINVGAFICNFVAAILRNQFGWGWAFTAAGIGMVVGVIVFMLGQKQLESASDRGDGSNVEQGILLKLSLQVFLPSLGAGLVGFFISTALGVEEGFFTPGNAAFVFAVIPIVVFYIVQWAKSSKEERGPMAALLAIFGVVIIFWMVFHQNGNTLTLWARDHTDRVAGNAAPVLEAVYMDQKAPPSYFKNIPVDDPSLQPQAERVALLWAELDQLTKTTDDKEVIKAKETLVLEEQRALNDAAGRSGTTLVSTELFQSINPGFIVIMTPLVVGFFALLRRRKKEPSTPAKIAWGLTITAASTLIMIMAVRATHDASVRGAGWWLVGTYGIITIGELFLSPMGLSLVSKLAPARVTGLMMGGWFLSTAIGNKLAGVVGGLWEKVDSLSTIFWINGICALAAAGAIAVMVPWIRRVMKEHAEGANNSNAQQESSSEQKRAS